MRTLAVTTAAAMLLLASGLASAQTAPSGAARPLPAPESRSTPEPQEREGTVSKVDPATQTIGVSRGWFGLFGRTLQ